MDNIHQLMRDTIMDTWKNSENKDKPMSSFGLGFSGSGVATLYIYKAGKIQKGDKKSIELKLDKDTTTAVVAIEVMKSILDEETNKSFISRQNKNERKDHGKKEFGKK